jgi:hypothetical protein
VFPDSPTTPWRWAGEYPIVDEPSGIIYLPHFQRSITDYEMLMKSYGIAVEAIVELPDTRHDLPNLVKQGVSPFKAFEGNSYWPYIGEAPSALAFIMRKDSERG